MRHTLPATMQPRRRWKRSAPASEFKPVRVRFAKNLSQGITIRLDAETLEKVRAEAHEKGIGPTTLIRMWVLEHVNQRPPGTV